MRNTNGGIIIFGIDEENDFEVTGVYDINDLQKQISVLYSDSMEPVVRPDFYHIEYEGKLLLAVEINEMIQNKKPCYYKPKGLAKCSYTRIGDRDEVMTDYEIYALQSYRDGIIEDIRPNKWASIEDLNREELEKYLNKVKEEKVNFAKNSEEKILKLSGITDNSDETIFPTLAGTMIFGDFPQAYYPQLLEALREAVANALIHRDYSVQTENAYISVNMYDNRIEIINPRSFIW